MIQINPKTLFSTVDVATMLNIDGLNDNRVRLLCDKGLVEGAHRTAGAGKWQHWRIPYGSLEAVVKAHETHRQTGRNVKRKYPTIEQFNELVERLSVLEQVVDEYTAPEVEPPFVSR